MSDQEKCWVYVIEIVGQEMVKIGISDNPKKRLRQLMTGSPFEMKLAHTVGAPTKDIARYLERSLHDVLSSQKCRGEWFKMSARDAILNLACAFASHLDRVEVPEDYNKAGFLMTAMHCAGIPDDLHGIAHLFTDEGRYLLDDPRAVDRLINESTSSHA